MLLPKGLRDSTTELLAQASSASGVIDRTTGGVRASWS